jgi:hypothetical protein
MAGGRRRAGRGEASAPVRPATLGPARRASRAAQRKRRRRQRRTRTSLFFVVATVLAVVAVAVLVGNAVTHHKTPPPKQRTQRTLLLSVVGSNKAGRAVTLLAYDPTPRRAAVVLIPPHTLADVAGIGNVVLGNALRLGGPRAASEAVADLMDVLVDNTWTLTSDAFSALVDRVGGVVVDVDTDVVTTVRGHPTVLVRAGPGQRLAGATALAYATYVGKGQDEITFQARFQTVLEALLAALPQELDALALSVSSLGPGSALTWEPRDLAAFLAGLRTARAEDRYEPQVLPVAPIDTGSGSSTFSIKVDDVKTLVDNQLAESRPPNRASGDNRVLILNGVGTPALGAGIARKLRGEFQVVGTRNKQPFGVKESVVVVFDSTDLSLEKGRRVASLLGLPPTAVRIGTQAQSVADVIVVIGLDYKD